MKKPLVVITGPTSCGKTRTAVMLAQRINGAVISADSMQVYKYMDIGTAKPDIEEMGGIRHYLIDELYPDEEYSVAVFQDMAQKYIDEIYSQQKIPILAGGTGFYINALLYGNHFSDAGASESCRAYYYGLAEEKGNIYLHGLLKEADPESYERIHPNNVKRVVRALEYHAQTGEKISAHNDEERRRESEYDASFIILSMERQKLYERINQRTDAMMAKGLVDEVKGLLEMGYGEELVSMQAIGYKETAAYLNGRCTLEEAVEIIKRDTRRYAKRQLTWFANQCAGCWINVDEFINYDIIVSKVIKSMEQGDDSIG